jgi:ribosomal protein S6--L-glutamate ligase
VRVLGLSVAGADLLIGKNGPILMEVNSSPGLKGLEKATGLDIAGEIISHALSLWERREDRVSGTEIEW